MLCARGGLQQYTRVRAWTYLCSYMCTHAHGPEEIDGKERSGSQGQCLQELPFVR